MPKQGGGLRGVRTKYSDDLLWLVYAACEYLEKTGDYSLLDVPVRYLQGPELEEDEHERYFEPSRSRVKEDVYDHCRRAVERSLKTGAHGLPLIGCGDWNDGYNRVGAKGRGESVWLAMFLSIVLERFADVCDRRGEDGDAVRYRRHARQLKADIDEHCWDGGWYIRAFYDDGAKMGSSESDECQIDSLPQSFSVLCGMPDTERVQTAMGSARERLVDWENDIIRLFAPAFADSVKDPGYVKAYPAGIRENGGQYTHASVWFAMAMLALGRADEGYALVKMLNPAHRCLDEKRARRYRLEPYYMAADIYTNPSAYARGGWSLYTGAAGWYYRTVVEQMLGIRLRGDELLLRPVLPDALEGFSAELRFADTRVSLRVRRGPAAGLTVDGENARGAARRRQPPGGIHLAAGGQNPKI
ncbi:MAG: GH36-type glycosyl hydrolase domain-containing protein [Oscillospiraceae bacterium]